MKRLDNWHGSRTFHLFCLNISCGSYTGKCIFTFDGKMCVNLNIFYHILRSICLYLFFLKMFQEQKIKEGLHMMGLRDDTFYISWFLTYCLQVNVILFCLNS